MAVVRVEREIAGRVLALETGKVARQAHGAVWVTYGDTVVLATVLTSPPTRDIDYFPLFVDYREYRYAGGKIPGGVFKREGRPSTKEILTMRMIDRPIRPLFPKDFLDEVQIQCLVLSTDNENDPDILGMIGASAALSLTPPYPPPGCRASWRSQRPWPFLWLSWAQLTSGRSAGWPRFVSGWSCRHLSELVQSRLSSTHRRAASPAHIALVFRPVSHAYQDQREPRVHQGAPLLSRCVRFPAWWRRNSCKAEYKSFVKCASYRRNWSKPS